MEPLPAGEGFDFQDATPGRFLPAEFVRAVEEGCSEAMESGVLAGYRLVDVRARLLDADEARAIYEDVLSDDKYAGG